MESAPHSKSDDTRDNSKAFLRFHCVPDAKCLVYALTPSSLAITIYRQQLRALNLAYAMTSDSVGTVREDGVVAVIGGGFAGLTVAAGLLMRKRRVHLFEQRPELCHLQSGCETRWIHPRAYDWPKALSDLDDARLPFLNWSAGSAGDVARTVVDQFGALVKKHETDIFVYLRANAKLIGDGVEWDNAVRFHDSDVKGWLGRCGQHNFDAVVLATGFGVEAGVFGDRATSYWRNDRFGQPQPGIRSERVETVLISGTGDGALVDLIRVCLQGFKHERLIDDLFSDKPELVQKLSSLLEAHEEELKDNPTANLLNEFKKLRYSPSTERYADQVKELDKYLRIKRRSDIRVILNGKAPVFAHVLAMKGRSFLNVVMAFFLYQADAFVYIGGECEPQSQSEVKILNSSGSKERGSAVTIRFDTSIYRHGSDRVSVLEAAGLTGDQITKLFEIQEKTPRRLNHRLWAPGWWASANNRVDPETMWKERVPKLECVIATVLTDSIRARFENLAGMSECRFRATVHHTLQFANPENAGTHCYQQLCEYVGNSKRANGGGGRVFLTHPSGGKGGLVSLAIRTGLAICAQPPDLEATSRLLWKNLWRELLPAVTSSSGKERFRNMDPDVVTTVIAWPLIATRRGGIRFVRYVIYVDIEHLSETLPQRQELTETLQSSAKEFANSINRLHASGVNGSSLFTAQTALDSDDYLPAGEASAIDSFEAMKSEFGSLWSTEVLKEADIKLVARTLKFAIDSQS